jgi:ABC-type polysaccharide/polyol phosphate transport system ATPase subunit
VIAAEGVGVRFLFDRHLRVVTPGEARLRGKSAAFWGLEDVTFSTEGGEGTALIGASGSGKTTLLRVLAGVFFPDRGKLLVQGRLASLLSVDAGLLSLLTGRENALLIGVIAGLSRRTLLRRMGDIKERSGLGDAFEKPVMTYSQGMRARLGFAVAEEVEPEILLLDEVHEALDHEFRNFLEQRAKAIIDRGGAVIAAGHDHPMLARFCTRAIWLEGGRVRADGRFDEIQPRYLAVAEGHEAGEGIG